MRPLQISADTAVKLAEKLRIPIEQLMHMPQHILLAKLAELAKEEGAAPTASADESGEPAERKSGTGESAEDGE
ncbi:hypothetical protein J31TS4_40750 [Paenibacillus sp. J31TS4]|uniref:YycC family protein n=1 Tax=Paenibacillus sp. J31TS4 TaxID=2807195 RepID=UPI001B26631D|nr:YycC family protein [Paenibacillus sp. J31TS4]GIP40795.1 hypothetical protein J31TS4_40750 [Paenibacillus sp. J31TS4]